MIRIVIGVVLMALLVVPVPAADSADEQRGALDKVRDSAKVVREVMGTKESQIPRELLEDAEVMMIFPNVLKAAFIFGGSGGSGLALARDPASGRWRQMPLFLKIGSGSVGFQIGGSSTDLILVGINRGAEEAVAKEEFTLGADASVAAGPIGRSAKAGTGWKLDSQFLSYSRSKGAFAGVSLGGSKIKVDKDRNAAVYGSAATAARILSGDVKPADPSMTKGLQQLASTLSRYTPAKPD
jgi:lipid-binding SYLF domain-containing protein